MVDIGQWDSRLDSVAGDLKIAEDNLRLIFEQAFCGSEEDTLNFYDARWLHEKIFELRVATEEFLDE